MRLLTMPITEQRLTDDMFSFFWLSPFLNKMLRFIDTFKYTFASALISVLCLFYWHSDMVTTRHHLNKIKVRKRNKKSIRSYEKSRRVSQVRKGIATHRGDTKPETTVRLGLSHVPHKFLVFMSRAARRGINCPTGWNASLDPRRRCWSELW